jgi:hypothetical protein
MPFFPCSAFAAVMDRRGRALPLDLDVPRRLDYLGQQVQVLGVVWRHGDTSRLAEAGADPRPADDAPPVPAPPEAMAGSNPVRPGSVK